MKKTVIDMKGEVWRRIESSPYSVSNMGRIKISVKGQPDMLRRTIRNAHLCTMSVAKLVAINFCANPNGYTLIQHVNGNERDNRASNIAWVKRNTAFAEGAHKSEFGRGGFKKSKKLEFSSYGEDEELGSPCVRCGTRDNDEPIRRGFCTECWCRILNHLGNGWDGMEPMLIEEALSWAEKAPMRELLRMSRIDSGPIRRQDIPRDRELRRLKEKGNESEG